MRLVPIILAALLVAIQFPLWLGRGGWMHVREMEQQLAAQNRTNESLQARNERLAAEVRDLKEGAGAVEERARSEIGMLKDGEVFVQIVEAPPQQAQQPPLPPAPARTP
jgi:cell division protein FtsB